MTLTVLHIHNQKVHGANRNLEIKTYFLTKENDSSTKVTSCSYSCCSVPRILYCSFSALLWCWPHLNATQCPFLYQPVLHSYRNAHAGCSESLCKLPGNPFSASLKLFICIFIEACSSNIFPPRVGWLSTMVAISQLSICQLELTLNLPHPSGIILTSLLKWSCQKHTNSGKSAWYGCCRDGYKLCAADR